MDDYRISLRMRENDLHRAAESGTVAEVKAVLARSDGEKLAMEQNSVSTVFF